MKYCKNDHDPYRNDHLTRLFEVFPPSSFDARLSQADRDYMVCFKQSRVTVNDSYCRYRYPREMIEHTSFDAAGVQQRSTLGHEFMNGFNYEMMATFRCNHDIQI
ncbi:hypothetical protein JG688_00014859 [Phytophthora aleatoria]|uniref:Uncharacterized protein n=1 Tax=Phytophthora aleatoria TaxID=2496075 RepID=A0A8J5LXA2_9STRA|nr:hypothetical protein JG688_00014859 [Phytophthora aleatoria]